MPINAVIMYDGLEADIPDNYLLCNGQPGTPDMRNLMVVGAGGTYAVGDTGGFLEHVHSYDVDQHTHDAGATHDCPGAGGIESATIFGTGQIAKAGTAFAMTGSGGTLPPFYALAFIKRMF